MTAGILRNAANTPYWGPNLDELDKAVKDASSLDRDAFIDSAGEPTDLFLAAQKYNHSTAASCNLVVNDRVPELQVPKLLEIASKDLFPEDKPEITDHNVRRYPGDEIDHSAEAFNIFFSTQWERLMSAIGSIFETVASWFGYNVTYFQEYHYRKNGETDADIYADDKPINLSKTEPTSYWLGHASLFLTVPLLSASGKRAPFHVITDPVEGDLNCLLYPRQTRFAKPMEEMPAPHVYLLSHNHLDHYSQSTIQKLLGQAPIMIVPKGDGELFTNLGFDKSKVHELDWWEQKEISFEKGGETYKMKITATPARHWSGQPCGGHESTFLGYVIQGHEEGDIYFAGDTARLNEDHITKLADNFNIRWNFQPGGPDEARKDMESTHQASVDGLWMHSKLMKKNPELKTVYMHTMTFKLGNLHLSDTSDSIQKLFKALKDKNTDDLKEYEKKVYDELTASGSEILEQNVIVPKIGSRLGLITGEGHEQNSQS